MKQLFLNPLYLSISLLIWGVYTFLTFKYANRNKVAAASLEFLFVLIFLLAITGVTIFPFPYLNPSALAGVDKTIGSLIAQLGIYASVIFILSSRFRNFFQSTRYLFKNPFLGLLICISILSTFWSETPIVTLKYGIVLLATSAFAAHFAKQYSWQKLSNFLRWSNTLIALLSIITVLWTPTIGLRAEEFPRWRGATDHPISLGNLMALNTFLWYLFLINKPKHRWLGLGLVVFSIIMMVLARSAGGFFSFFAIVTLSVLLHLIKRLNFNQAFIAVIFFTILGTVTTIFLLENLESFFIFFGKDTTLTGRTEFWPQVVEAIKQHPLLGYGYKGFWQDWRGNQNPAWGIQTSGGFVPTHSHNGFLDLALNLGLVGLLLFIFSFLQNIAWALQYINCSRVSESILPLAILMFLVIKNVSQNGLWEINLDLFLYVFVTVRLSIDTLGKGTRRNQSSRTPTLLLPSTRAKAS